jgi:glycolate oxidase iron-sulfur subunit
VNPREEADAGRAVTTHLPEGARFIGPEPGALPGWAPGDAPAYDDIISCVACGLCLPHCPTYRLTGEESASPRGRVAAMRAVAEGTAIVDETFGEFMDLCLSCRACEDVCPSHVPFGRMMERARAQLEPTRPARHRFLRFLGFDVVLPRGWLLTAITALMPATRPFVPKRVRALIPRPRTTDLFRPIPRITEPAGPPRGTVAILAGCVQDRWFRPANRATVRVLARNGWRVVVPRQACCGALHAHYGHLATARKLARRNMESFADVDWIVVNSAGCGAHMKEYGELLGPAGESFSLRVRDFMEFFHEQGIEAPPASPFGRVAIHDPCHLLRAQRIHEAPRAVLTHVPGLQLAEVPMGDRCCGAAGLYNVLQPEMANELMRQKADAIASTGAPAVAVANPGCAMQIRAGLDRLGGSAAAIEVLHPAEILDRAYGG